MFKRPEKLWQTFAANLWKTFFLNTIPTVNDNGVPELDCWGCSSTIYDLVGTPDSTRFGGLSVHLQYCRVKHPALEELLVWLFDKTLSASVFISSPVTRSKNLSDFMGWCGAQSVKQISTFFILQRTRGFPSRMIIHPRELCDRKSMSAKAVWKEKGRIEHSNRVALWHRIQHNQYN